MHLTISLGAHGSTERRANILGISFVHVRVRFRVLLRRFFARKANSVPASIEECSASAPEFALDRGR
jgi:hypothetical protein